MTTIPDHARAAVPKAHVRLTDSTLRDGSHAARHRFTTDQEDMITDVAIELAAATSANALQRS